MLDSHQAKALDSLAGFYDACAQVEIDEYQNYEKVGSEALLCICLLDSTCCSTIDAFIFHLFPLT
jgi:hypothetical protein